MKFYPLFGLIAAALAMPLHAQDTQAPTAPQNTEVKPAADSAAPTPTATQNTEAKPDSGSAPASAAEVREALKKEGETSQTKLLKQTLTAADKNYSMLKRGGYALTYGMNYTYIGQEKINTDLASGTATLFSIENNNSHTITNSLSLDYGLLNNLTGNVTLPFVSKYSQTAVIDGTSHTIGDISIGARVQPFELQPDIPTLTVTGTFRMPTGTSPFKVISGSGEATGSGVAAFTAGLNVNQVVDPVALFGSLNVTYNFPAKNLNQMIGTGLLTQVNPGMSLGFGVGFAYALSYAISTQVSFQESIAHGSKLTFLTGSGASSSVMTNTQTSGILSFGMGYRLSPKTTVNTSIGIGLTANAPNMSIDVTLPVSF